MHRGDRILQRKMRWLSVHPVSGRFCACGLQGVRAGCRAGRCRGEVQGTQGLGHLGATQRRGHGTLVAGGTSGGAHDA
jgi:hypothetical protein